MARRKRTSRYKVKGKLGSGKRFKRLVKTLSKRKGVKTPKKLAAWIGRKKYGKKRFQALAAKGRRRASRKRRRRK